MTIGSFVRLVVGAIVLSVLWVGCAVKTVAAAYVRWPSETLIVCIGLGLLGLAVVQVLRSARGNW